MINNSVKKCRICDNKQIGEFITINDKKYHLCCIEQLQKRLEEVSDGFKAVNEELIEFAEENQQLQAKIDNAIDRLQALIVFWKKYNSIDYTMEVEQFKGVINLLKGDDD